MLKRLRNPDLARGCVGGAMFKDMVILMGVGGLGLHLCEHGRVSWKSPQGLPPAVGVCSTARYRRWFPVPQERLHGDQLLHDDSLQSFGLVLLVGLVVVLGVEWEVALGVEWDVE